MKDDSFSGTFWLASLQSKKPQLLVFKIKSNFNLGCGLVEIWIIDLILIFKIWIFHFAQTFHRHYWHCAGLEVFCSDNFAFLLLSYKHGILPWVSHVSVRIEGTFQGVGNLNYLYLTEIYWTTYLYIVYYVPFFIGQHIFPFFPNWELNCP